jgi:hypothetical protein
VYATPSHVRQAQSLHLQLGSENADGELDVGHVGRKRSQAKRAGSLARRNPAQGSESTEGELYV